MEKIPEARAESWNEKSESSLTYKCLRANYCHPAVRAEPDNSLLSPKPKVSICVQGVKEAESPVQAESEESWLQAAKGPCSVCSARNPVPSSHWPLPRPGPRTMCPGPSGHLFRDQLVVSEGGEGQPDLQSTAEKEIHSPEETALKSKAAFTTHL